MGGELGIEPCFFFSFCLWGKGFSGFRGRSRGVYVRGTRSSRYVGQNASQVSTSDLGHSIRALESIAVDCDATRTQKNNMKA